MKLGELLKALLSVVLFAQNRSEIFRGCFKNPDWSTQVALLKVEL